jgi:hypothetical protein
VVDGIVGRGEVDTITVDNAMQTVERHLVAALRGRSARLRLTAELRGGANASARWKVEVVRDDGLRIGPLEGLLLDELLVKLVAEARRLSHGDAT